MVEGEAGRCEIGDLKHVEGEASCNSRKGKLIFFYEWNLRLSWKGTGGKGDARGSAEIAGPWRRGPARGGAIGTGSVLVPAAVGNLSPPGWENGNVSASCSDSVVGRLREPRGPGLDKCVFLNNLETRDWLLPLHPGFFHRVFLSSAFPVYQHGVTHLALLDVDVCIVVALTAQCRGCFSSTVPKVQLCAPPCLCRAGKPKETSHYSYFQKRTVVYIEELHEDKTL